MFDSHFFIVFIICVAALSVFSVCAAQENDSEKPVDSDITGKCGPNLTFTFNPFSHILVINGTGEMYQFTRYKPAWFYYKSSIWAVVFDEGATTIGDYAFQECSNLMTVILPSTLTTIKTAAFIYCSKLSSIKIPQNVEIIENHAFYFTNLGNITLPYGLKRIGSYAFSHCKRLSYAFIPITVDFIDYAAFTYCDNLKNITVEDYNLEYKSIDGVLFDFFGRILIQYPCGKNSTYDIPSGVREVDGFAFTGCNKLESVTFPNTVTKIGSNVFLGCSSLKSVTLPDIEEIGSSLFSECSSLNNIVIPSTVKSIGMSAFEGCESLSSIVIPAAVKSISQGAFGSCSALKEIKLADGNTNFKVISSVLFDHDGVSLIQYPCGKEGSYDIPKDVTTIKPYAFYGCKNLTSVSIHSNVKTIGHSAFFGCGLTSVAIPANVGSIEIDTFKGCNSLASVTIEKGIKSIGNSAFDGCSSLKNMTIPSSVTKISANAFSWCSGLQAIYVDDEKNSNFKSLDGVLFDTDNTLVRYPCGKTGPYTIPNTVKNVGSFAFEGCDNLQVDVIPKGVNTIGAGAFDKTSGFTTMTISSDVNSIQFNAFLESSSLVSVTYLGTSEPGSGNRPFQDCDSLETMCVPSNYESKTFGDRDDFCKSDTCKDLVSEINQCYEVTCVGGNAKVEKRENATRWENKSDGCVEYSCDNNTGLVTVVKCGKDDVCVDGECIKFSELKKQGYSAVMDMVDLNSSDVNPDDAKRILSTDSDLTLGTVIGDDGSALSVVVNVPFESDANFFVDSVGNIDKVDCNYIEYRVFCFCNNSRVISKDLDDFSGTYRNSVVLIPILILAMLLFM